MERAKVLILTVSLLLLISTSDSQRWRGMVPPRPLCPVQFGLANSACSALPIYQVPPPPPPSPPPSPKPPSPKPKPPSPPPPSPSPSPPPPSPPSPSSPPPPSPPSPDDEEVHLHHIHDDHDHRHDGTELVWYNQDPSPTEQECCRWLKAIDTECVCDVLVRLPPFLSKPLHKYTVLVDSVCNVTYTCGSRIFG